MAAVHTRRRRMLGTIGGLGLLLSALTLAGTAAPASASTSITSAGPLTSITISDTLNCAVNYLGDSAGEWYSNIACGTFVAAAGNIYGPTSVPAGSGVTGVANYVPYTPISQTGPSGSGTAADPYTITTVVSLGTSGLTLTERDTYVVGQETTRADVTLNNQGNAAVSAIVYRAGDCYLQDSDVGRGQVGPGAITCLARASSVAPDRIEQFRALTPGYHYLEDSYSTVWSAVGAGVNLPDTCRCDEEIDNGIAMSWAITVAAGGTTTISSLTAFSPTGAQPLQVDKTVTPGTTTPGGTVTYHVTVNNPGATPATVTSITDTLPAGFSYQAGTTTGATTTDPTISGNQLVWSGSWNVPAATGGTPGSITLDFNATASSTPGTYRNSVTADGPGLTVIPAIDVAPVVVEGTTPTDPPPPPTLPTIPTIPTSSTSTTTTTEATTSTSEPDEPTTTEIDTTTTVPDTPSTPTEPPTSASGSGTASTPLARTGGDQGPMVAAGLSLLTLGAMVLILRRRMIAHR